MKLAIYALPALLLAATPALAQATTATASDDATSPRGGTMDTTPKSANTQAAPLEGSTTGLANTSGALNNGNSASTAPASAMDNSTRSVSSAAPSNQMAMNTPRAKSHVSERKLNAEEAQETKQLNQDQSQYSTAQ